MTRKPSTAKPRAVDPVSDAGDATRDLGHVPRRAGRTYSCWHCSLEGLVGPDGKRIGDIFERSCGK